MGLLSQIGQAMQYNPGHSVNPSSEVTHVARIAFTPWENLLVLVAKNFVVDSCLHGNSHSGGCLYPTLAHWDHIRGVGRFSLFAVAFLVAVLWCLYFVHVRALNKLPESVSEKLVARLSSTAFSMSMLGYGMLMEALLIRHP